ncbi:hypothetical protein EDC96DRAFT_567072 [Choanephora cucurbitarum]|nr:hypothetical protein EDC96DRAFT_567072 [Choanephora cucurbitarum]
MPLTHSTIQICTGASMSHKNDMVVPAIDDSDSNFYTSLLESSSNKKYLAYISTDCFDHNLKHSTDSKATITINSDPDKSKSGQFYLTFRSQPEFGFNAKPLHLTRIVTHIFPQVSLKSHIFFLSVSNDGQFISISSFDRCVDGSYCIIYQVKKDRIEKINELIEINKIGGYGIFLDDYRFAMINEHSLYVYNQHFRLAAYFSISSLVQNTWRYGLTADMVIQNTFFGLYNGKDGYNFLSQGLLNVLSFVCQQIKQGILCVIDQTHCFQVYVIGDDLRRITDGKDKVFCVSSSKTFYAVFDGKNGWHIIGSSNNVVAYRLRVYQCMDLTTFFSLQAAFSDCERYFVASAIVLDKKKQFVHSLYVEVWDLFLERSIYCKKRKLDSVIPLDVRKAKFWPPILAFDEQDEEKHRFVRPAMRVTYTMYEKDEFFFEPVDVIPEKCIPRHKVFYNMNQKVQSHLLEPIGGIYSFDEIASKKLHAICLRRDQDTPCLIVQISNRGEIYYSFELQGEFYCIVVRAQMLEVWHRRSIHGTTYANLSKQKINKMDRSLKEIYYDSEMIFARTLECMFPSFDNRDRANCTIKNFDRLVNIESMPTAEEIENSVQILEGSSDKGISLRLRLESSGIMRSEDIYIPIIKLSGRKNDLYNRRWYCDYVFESACRVLFYFSDLIDPKDTSSSYYSKKKARKQHILRIIWKCLENMKELKSNYFESVRGSDTLSLLSLFEDGRKIVFTIVQMQEINICLFSRRRLHAAYRPNIKVGISALTVLIDQKNFGLYKILLNRIIHDSSKINGFPLSFCIIDALLLLQHEKNKDLLSKTIVSLDFIPIEKSLIDGNFSIETNDRFEAAKKQSLIQDKNLFRHTFTQMEQVEANGFYKFNYSQLVYSVRQRIYQYPKRSVISRPSLPGTASLTGNYIKPCIVPLSHLCTYYNIDSDLPPPYGPSLSIKNYKEKSAFIVMATNHTNSNVFDEGELVTALVLQHKWQQFIQNRFFLVSHIYLLFYFTYFLAVPFSYERFGYISGESFVTDSKGHLACVILFFASNAFLVFQETRQCQASPKKYFSSFHNYIDILLVFLTVFTFVQMVCKMEYSDEFQSVCALVVWWHGLFKLRAFHYFGVTLEVVIHLFHKVSQIILFMVLVVFAFTNAFIILLRKKDDSYFQEQYSGTIGIESSSKISFTDGTSNDFTNVFKSFKDVWFFIYGVWDPITSGDSGDNTMVMILAIVFSFIVLLLFFNIVIGFMSASIGEVIQQGRKAWLNHFRDVIVEIEQFWCTNLEKKRSKNNPAFMFYAANDDEIKRQQELLRNETGMLIKEYEAMQQLS